MPNRRRMPMDGPACAFCLSLVVVTLTWVALFWAIGIATWSLTPYDSIPLMQRPPLGTFERTINDFFESPVGGNLPGATTVGISLVLLAFVLGRVSANSFQRAKLVLSFAGSNLIVSAAIVGMFFVVGDLPVHLAPYPGYGWTVKFLVPQILLLVLLLVFQGRIIPAKLRWVPR